MTDDAGGLRTRLTSCAEPLADLPIGHDLRWRYVEPLDVGGSGTLPRTSEDWGFADGALLNLGFFDGQSLKGVGNAVMVAPGLAATAYHVYEDEIDLLHCGQLSAMCWGPRRGVDGDIWRVVSLSHNPLHDLALLSLSLASKITEQWSMTVFRLTDRIPEPGETLTVAGFIVEPCQLQSNTKSKAFGNLLVSNGPMIRHESDGFESKGMRGPLLQIGCEINHGMSGGPVFDEESRLVGIASWSFEGNRELGPMFAASTVPALDMRIDMPWPPSAFDEVDRLRDLGAALDMDLGHLNSGTTA